METKYKIKDKVEYWETYYNTTRCGECGAEETKGYRKRRRGVITKIHKDIVFRLSDDFETTVETLPNGDTIETPFTPNIKPLHPEPIYTIGNNTHTEEEIIKKI